MSKLICFDVDGVLVDSRDEILVATFNDFQYGLIEKLSKEYINEKLC